MKITLPAVPWGRWLLMLALLVFAWAQLRLWVGTGGVRDILRIQHAVVAQKQENRRLLERNRVLRAEVLDLKTGTTAIEEHARLDLGMVRNNETFYMIPGAPPPMATPSQTQEP